MSNPRDKGTKAETALVKWARGNGFPRADRIPRKGAFDEGDVRLTGAIIVEVKNSPSRYNANLTPLAWLYETETERQRAGAGYGFLVVKPTGIGWTRVGDWHCWMPASDLVDRHRAAFAPDPDPYIRMRVEDMAQLWSRRG